MKKFGFDPLEAISGILFIGISVGGVWYVVDWVFAMVPAFAVMDITQMSWPKQLLLAVAACLLVYVAYDWIRLWSKGLWAAIRAGVNGLRKPFEDDDY